MSVATVESDRLCRIPPCFSLRRGAARPLRFAFDGARRHGAQVSIKITSEPGSMGLTCGNGTGAAPPSTPPSSATVARYSDQPAPDLRLPTGATRNARSSSRDCSHTPPGREPDERDRTADARCCTRGAVARSWPPRDLRDIYATSRRDLRDIGRRGGKVPGSVRQHPGVGSRSVGPCPLPRGSGEGMVPDGS